MAEQHGSGRGRSRKRVEPRGPIQELLSDLLGVGAKHTKMQAPAMLHPLIDDVAGTLQDALAQANWSRGVSLDPHRVLGVDKDADWDTIVARHRELVKKVHPDMHGSDQLFQVVQQAYEELEKRHKKA